MDGGFPIDLEDDDPDLREAIRLSMQDAVDLTEDRPAVADSSKKKTRKRKEQEVIVLDDSDGEDVAQASTSRTNAPPEKVADSSARGNGGTSSSSAGILGLDRAQMEKERLERLKKRKLEVPNESYSYGYRKKSPRLEAPSSAKIPYATESNFHALSSTTSASNKKDEGTSTTQKGAAKSNSKLEMRFPNGVVKKTYIQGRARGQDDISIEELLQKDHLRLAVLSSFMWQIDWILEKLDVEKTYKLLVVQAKGVAEQEQHRAMLKNIPRTKLAFPRMDGAINCMHSKLQLLVFDNFLRIAVPTANLTDFDWGEGGIMENMVFIIDLPYLSEFRGVREPFVETQFSRSLVQFCRACNMEDFVFKKLDTVDFSVTKDIAFVHSMGGSHVADHADTTGILGLSTAIRSLGLQIEKEEAELDFVASSLGFLKKEFLVTVYSAAMGLPLNEIITRKTIPRAKKEKDAKKDYWEDIKAKFRVYFPSKRTVAASSGGVQNGGTICFQDKWFRDEKFPKHILRECESARERMLMHNKCLFFRFPKSVSPSSTNNSYDGWAYVGSHNLSESAWGTPTLDKITGQRKISIRNWECGVIIPLKSGTTPALPAGETGKPGNAKVPLTAFEGTVPVPMKVPAKMLTTPWFFMNQR